jgi:hypothetical protein
MDEPGIQNFCADSSGNGNRGELYYGATAVSEMRSGYVTFDGTDDCIYVSTFHFLESPTSLTVSAWINSSYDKRDIIV